MCLVVANHRWQIVDCVYVHYALSPFFTSYFFCLRMRKLWKVFPTPWPKSLRKAVQVCGIRTFYLYQTPLSLHIRLYIDILYWMNDENIYIHIDSCLLFSASKVNTKVVLLDAIYFSVEFLRCAAVTGKRILKTWGLSGLFPLLIYIFLHHPSFDYYI